MAMKDALTISTRMHLTRTEEPRVRTITVRVTMDLIVYLKSSENQELRKVFDCITAFDCTTHHFTPQEIQEFIEAGLRLELVSLVIR